MPANDERDAIPSEEGLHEAQRRNQRTFWRTGRGSPLKGWGASGSSKSRVVGDDRPGTGLRAHLFRASTAGGQQSRASRVVRALSSAEPAPESTYRVRRTIRRRTPHPVREPPAQPLLEALEADRTPRCTETQLFGDPSCRASTRGRVEGRNDEFLFERLESIQRTNMPTRIGCPSSAEFDGMGWNRKEQSGTTNLGNSKRWWGTTCPA